MGKISKIWQYLKEYGISHTCRKVYNRYQIKYRIGSSTFPFEVSAQVMKEQSAWIPKKWIRISILVPLYNTPEHFLREMLDSVCNQSYDRWELCLADASDNPQMEHTIQNVIREYHSRDLGNGVIQYQKLESNEGISDNSNQALNMATGDYIALMDHDDLLHPEALYQVMKQIDAGADMVYTDELSFVGETRYVQSVHLKPDFCLESFRNNNYICHFTVFDRQLIDKTGGFRSQYDGSQDYDLFLRLVDVAQSVRHVSGVYYFWRLHAGSVASGVGAKPYTVEAGRLALCEHLERRGIQADVSSSELYGPFYKVDYHVNQGSRVLCILEDEAMRWNMEWSQVLEKKDCSVSVTDHLSKTAVVENDYLVFCQKGYRPIENSTDWLLELICTLVPEEIGATGPMTIDSKKRVQQAGYCYDQEWTEYVRPLYAGMPFCDPGYMNRLRYRQNVSLVGRGALAVKRRVWLQFAEEYGDRDWFQSENWFLLCLYMQKQGYTCAVSSDAVLIDQEGSSKPILLSEQGKKMWLKMEVGTDPCFNSYMKTYGKYCFLW